jgi:hypothetical protein
MKLASLTLVAILQGCVDARILGQRDSSTVNSSFNVLDYVDPLIGTANGGLSTSKHSYESKDSKIDIQVMCLLVLHCLLVSVTVHHLL